MDSPWPVTIDEAAERWHCGVRWLKDYAKEKGFGRRAGKVILLSEAEYEGLYGSLPCHSNLSKEKARKSGISEGLSMGAAFKRRQARLTKKAQSSSASSARRPYGKKSNSAAGETSRS